MTVDTSSRLAALRSLMKERNVDIYGTPPPPRALHTLHLQVANAGIAR